MDKRFIVACTKEAKAKLMDAGYQLVKSTSDDVYYFINDESIKPNFNFSETACAYTDTLTF